MFHPPRIKHTSDAEPSAVLLLFLLMTAASTLKSSSLTFLFDRTVHVPAARDVEKRGRVVVVVVVGGDPGKFPSLPEWTFRACGRAAVLKKNASSPRTTPH